MKTMHILIVVCKYITNRFLENILLIKTNKININIDPVKGMGIFWVDNEINSSNKHSLRSNTKGYGGKTHWTDSQNSVTTAPSGRELYHLQFLLQASSPETFGYTPEGCVLPFVALSYYLIMIKIFQDINWPYKGHNNIIRVQYRYSLLELKGENWNPRN
jgi:hypothetical protein